MILLLIPWRLFSERRGTPGWAKIIKPQPGMWAPQPPGGARGRPAWGPFSARVEDRHAGWNAGASYQTHRLSRLFRWRKPPNFQSEIKKRQTPGTGRRRRVSHGIGRRTSSRQFQIPKGERKEYPRASAIQRFFGPRRENAKCFHDLYFRPPHGNTIATWTRGVATTLRLTQPTPATAPQPSPRAYRLDAIAFVAFRALNRSPSDKFPPTGIQLRNGLVPRYRNPGTLKEGGGVEASGRTGIARPMAGRG